MVNSKAVLSNSISREEACKSFYLERLVELRENACRPISEDEEEENKGGGSITVGGRVDSSGNGGIYVECEGHNASGNVSGRIHGEAGRNSSGDAYAEVKGEVVVTW
ncbi:MAG: hypothetical protein H6620_12325 [Halobacteriovoraceae bacterium]|nr:hypothetical protein [Halobacteriovoraceae bacterium]